MTLTQDDLLAIENLFSPTFDAMSNRFTVLEDQLNALDYKIDTVYDKLHEEIGELSATVHRIDMTVTSIERSQIAEIGRVDKHEAAINKVNRKLGLA